MAVLRQRKRILFFRVSEDEYQQFRGFCERQGARSLSDLARKAVFRLIEEGETTPGHPVAAGFLQIDREIRALKEEVTNLTRLVEVRANGDPDAASGWSPRRKGPAKASEPEADSDSAAGDGAVAGGGHVF